MPQKPTRAMLAAIGEVASDSALVDEGMRDLIGLLLGSPYAQVIVAGEESGRLSELIVRVALFHKGLTDEAVDQLLTIKKALDLLRENRNFLVHATWEKLSTPREHIGARSRRPGRSIVEDRDTMRQYDVWKVDEVLQVAAYYRDIAAGLDKFMDENFGLEPYPTITSRARDAHITEKLREMGFGPLIDG